MFAPGLDSTTHTQFHPPDLGGQGERQDNLPASFGRNGSVRQPASQPAWPSFFILTSRRKAALALIEVFNPDPCPLVSAVWLKQIETAHAFLAENQTTSAESDNTSQKGEKKKKTRTKNKNLVLAVCWWEPTLLVSRPPFFFLPRLPSPPLAAAQAGAHQTSDKSHHGGGSGAFVGPDPIGGGRAVKLGSVVWRQQRRGRRGSTRPPSPTAATTAPPAA